MDPLELSALSKPPSFALNLLRLPYELVVQVIDDLPLIQIFQILSHKDRYLDSCVIASNKWRRHFRNPADISTAIDYFILYREICRWKRQSLSPVQGPCNQLNNNSGEPFDANERRRLFVESIVRHLELNVLDESLLRAHSEHQDNSTIWTRWEWIKVAKLRLAAAKARQLDASACLMARYPDKLMVRRPLDPDSQGPRPNTAHIEDFFRRSAKKRSGDRKIQHRYFKLRCCPGVDNIPLVPYDRFLWTFLGTLEKYPLVDADGDTENSLQSLSLGEKVVVSTSTEALIEPYRYPEDIAAMIKVVKDGLMYVYTGSPQLVVPRIQWSLSEVPDSLSKESRPVFFINKQPHSKDLPQNLHRCPARKIMPHDDREYEWLETFLKVVTWMEDNLELSKSEG